MNAFAIFPRGAVALTGPDAGALRHDALRTFRNPQGYCLAFCTRCGAHVFGLVEGSDEIELHLGSFDEPNLFTPTYESWTVRREHWLGQQPTVLAHFERDRLDG